MAPHVLRALGRSLSQRLQLRGLQRRGIAAPTFASTSSTLTTSSWLVPSSRLLHTSVVLDKVHKGEKDKKKAGSVLHSFEHTENAYVAGAKKEMEDMEQILIDELSKHFSLQVDLRTYEDIIVKLEKGDEHRLSHLARVTLKTPQLIMINFADNPAAIKYAKLAIQKSLLTVQPQHEGVVLYVTAPRMTRERREQLAAEAKGKIFNQYKKAVNEVYIKYDKRNTKEVKVQDEAKATRDALLNLKHAMEKRATDIIEMKRQALLKEVV